MSEANEALTPEEVKKKAYLMGLRLKNSGLDAETIYARLEKQGIPEDLAREVAYNTVIERKKETVKQAETSYNVALFRIAIGVSGAILAYFITGNLILPLGIIAGGIVFAVLAKKKMEE